MGQRWRSNGKLNSGDESVAVIIVSSSDDEAANEDLRLKMQREVKWRSSGNGPGEAVQISVIDLSSTSSDEVEVAPDLVAAAVCGGGLVAPPEAGTKKKRRRKSRKKKNGAEEKLPVAADSVEVDKAFDNVVLQRLRRGPRYFDPGERILETCYNCREEGHAAVNCTMKRRQKPCFVCGRFGHCANQCPQGRDCYICKRRGHLAKSCPYKHKQIAEDSMICLRCGNVGQQRCGDIGHDILSCTNDYAPDDLKELQCYICNDYGHLCCVGPIFSSPREVSCCNCAQFGHTESGCAKQRGEISAVSSPTLCYKCGEEGHFARWCTKNTKV